MWLGSQTGSGGSSPAHAATSVVSKRSVVLEGLEPLDTDDCPALLDKAKQASFKARAVLSACSSISWMRFEFSGSGLLVPAIALGHGDDSRSRSFPCGANAAVMQDGVQFLRLRLCNTPSMGR